MTAELHRAERIASIIGTIIIAVFSVGGSVANWIAIERANGERDAKFAEIQQAVTQMRVDHDILMRLDQWRRDSSGENREVGRPAGAGLFRE